MSIFSKNIDKNSKFVRRVYRYVSSFYLAYYLGYFGIYVPISIFIAYLEFPGSFQNIYTFIYSAEHIKYLEYMVREGMMFGLIPVILHNIFSSIVFIFVGYAIYYSKYRLLIGLMFYLLLESLLGLYTSAKSAWAFISFDTLLNFSTLYYALFCLRHGIVNRNAVK